MSVKIVMTGRPGTIQKQSQFVTFKVYSQVSDAPPLPKVLPPLRGYTTYLVLIAPKQWAKVEKQINDNKEDLLYIEGHPTMLPNYNGIVVRATTVNTLARMKARKEEQRQQAQG
jgi:hypothetical protein